MAVDQNIENLQFLTKPMTQSGEKYLITFDVNVEQSYTGCPRRNVQDFGRVFLMLNYTDITQNTYIQS